MYLYDRHTFLPFDLLLTNSRKHQMLCVKNSHRLHLHVTDYYPGQRRECQQVAKAQPERGGASLLHTQYKHCPSFPTVTSGGTRRKSELSTHMIKYCTYVYER